MASAKRLPSGAYRVQYKIDGKVYSVTRDTAKQAEMAALEHQLNKKRTANPGNITLGKAIDSYIESKSNILSPSTIRGYRGIQKKSLTLIIERPVGKLTANELQKQFNLNAASYSAKSIANQYGLVTSVLKSQGITFDSIALKPKSKIEYHIPSPEQLGQILKGIEGTGELELYVLCMMTLGLRNSEASALDWGNYDGDCIRVNGALVLDVDNQYVMRSNNKTYDSKRLLQVPDILKEKLDAAKVKNGRIFPRTSTAYYKLFIRMLERNGLPHFKLYDLRHAYASVMLLLGVPDKYAMELMGHSTPNMLKTVYQHTFDVKKNAVSRQINDYFNELMKK